MKTLSNLIKGLQIIEGIEKEKVEFNSQNGYLYIGEYLEYSETQLQELEKLGFVANEDYDCFEFNLD